MIELVEFYEDSLPERGRLKATNLKLKVFPSRSGTMAQLRGDYYEERKLRWSLKQVYGRAV